MIRYAKDMALGAEENPAGGKGHMTIQTLMTPHELENKTGMFAVATLEPGAVVGEHLHTQECEVYYILSGSGTMIEDGVRSPIAAGDLEFCPKGHSHGLENASDAPLSFLALELK